MYRHLFLGLAVVATATLVGQFARADERPHRGAIVKAGDSQLTFERRDKEYTRDVADDAKIKLDRKTADLDDLKEGVRVRVKTGDDEELNFIAARTKAERRPFAALRSLLPNRGQR